MWEGQIHKGVPKGFVRYIDAISNMAFVGYNDGINFASPTGTLLEFEDHKLKLQGRFDRNSQTGSGAFNEGKFFTFEP